MAKTDDTPAPEPVEAEPSPASDEPDWARNLRQSIEQLPAKLKATVSDDDRNSIAEAVHGLFERSGAFHAPEPEPEAEPESDDPTGPPAPEDRPPETKTLAERLGFPKH